MGVVGVLCTSLWSMLHGRRPRPREKKDGWASVTPRGQRLAVWMWLMACVGNCDIQHSFIPVISTGLQS